MLFRKKEASEITTFFYNIFFSFFGGNVPYVPPLGANVIKPKDLKKKTSYAKRALIKNLILIKEWHFLYFPLDPNIEFLAPIIL